MKKFLKDTRGVVMMEYIILGLFAVAITVASVHALGKVYNNGLLAMSAATLGATTDAENAVQSAAMVLTNDASIVYSYGDRMVDKDLADVANGYGWSIFDGQ